MSEEKKTYMPVVSIKKVENGPSLVVVSVYVNTGHAGEPWPDMRNDPVYVRYCVSTKGWEDHDPEKEWLCLDDGLRYFAPSDIVREWISKRISESAYDSSVPYEHRWKGYVETPDPSIHWTVPPCSG